jgi:hypothetical protein
VDFLDPNFLLYVVILAIVAISTLVKKVFEKAASKDEGKKVDLREAVREQLRRYMGEGQEQGGPFPVRPFGRPVEPPRPSPPAPPRPAGAAPGRAAVAPPPPPPLPAKTPVEEPAMRPELALPKSHPRMGTGPFFSGAELRRAILFAEILGPPVSERRPEQPG